MVTFMTIESRWGVTIILMINHYTVVFLDTTVESIIIQQARRDPLNGQQDLQAFRIIFFGLGAVMGGVASGIGTEYFTPYHLFFFNFIIAALITIAGCFTSKELETNKYATMKDPQEMAFYA